MMRVGEIRKLEVKTAFPLWVEGQLAATYICDFDYERQDPIAPGHWERIVEDVKAPITKTPMYRLKKRLVKILYGIEIVET